MESVKEYIDLIYGELGELRAREMTYRDYDQMTDWLGEIRNHVKRIESAEQDHIAEIEKLKQYAEDLEYQIHQMRKYSED